MTRKKLIIEAVLNEAVPKENNPNVPYGREEVAADAAACAAAGASVIHFHARDAQTGEHSWTDPQRYRETMLAMRGHGVSDALIWYPTYRSLDRHGLSHVAALAADPEMRLPLSSVEIGTTNINEFNPATGRFAFSDSVMALSHAGARDMLGMCRELGVKPYLGVYEPGQLRHIAAYLENGWIEPPLAIKLVFSDFSPFGLPPSAECVGMYAELIDMTLPGVAVEWFASCLGPSIWEVVTAAVELGGHARIGIGQYHPWGWVEPTNDQPSNVEQVERLAALARERNREIASPAESRELLGIKRG